MTKVYVLDCNELLAHLKQGSAQHVGYTALYCNYNGVIETILDEYFYNALYNKHTATELLMTLGIASDPAELMAGYCRTMLHGQLRRLLHDVPADRWLEYKVLPWGEINIIDYVDDSTFMENKFLAATYWQDLDAERKALEDGKPTPQYKAAIVKEMNEGNWVQESIRRFAGL